MCKRGGNERDTTRDTHTKANENRNKCLRSRIKILFGKHILAT